MVRVLPKQHYFYLLKWGVFERCKHRLTGWVNGEIHPTDLALM